jgi:hypothetical protein
VRGIASTYAATRVLRVESAAAARIVLPLSSSTCQFGVAALVAMTLWGDERLLPSAIGYCLLMWLVPVAAMASDPATPPLWLITPDSELPPACSSSVRCAYT